MATVQITGERLKAMDDNGMRVYATPGAQEVYWASAPSWRDDTCVATVADFLDAAGYDELDESLFDELFELDVPLLPAQV